ncbi:hypothetical protein F7Q90_09655 [Pantoea stewartii subsp. stewartii]|nr:hypothetical protein F7Q90_09655 [Pantoea stewartii subsp. stewartii]
MGWLKCSGIRISYLNADYLFITIILALCRCFDLFYCVKCAGVLITGIDYTFGFYTDRCLL